MFAHQQSSLNPDAPMFAPMAYQAVEDFSDHWWSLIQPSTWFRDYWLQERYQDPQLTSSSPTTSISSTTAPISSASPAANMRRRRRNWG
ncbi:unnamed protein product [Linum tenue]|uniref:Uncharacterized protein n=1 Tax=Linum tenue TaxID=586396 RepID=A0AAV0MEW7_9ROSI|nr:unnamed protein product [Linum tenue]